MRVQYCPSPARPDPNPGILAAQYPSYGSSEQAIPSATLVAQTRTRESIFLFFEVNCNFLAVPPRPTRPPPGQGPGRAPPRRLRGAAHYPGNPQVARPPPHPRARVAGIGFQDKGLSRDSPTWSS